MTWNTFLLILVDITDLIGSATYYHMSHENIFKHWSNTKQKLRPETLQWQAGTFISLFSRLALPWNSISTAAVKLWNLSSEVLPMAPIPDRDAPSAMQSARRLPLWLCRRGTTGRRDGQRPSHNWDAWMAPSPSSDATSLLIHGCQVPLCEWLPNHNAPLSFGNARSSGNIEQTYWSRSDGPARCPTRCKFVSRQSSADLSRFCLGHGPVWKILQILKYFLNGSVSKTEPNLPESRKRLYSSL